MHRCVRAFEKLENEGCTQIAAAIKQQVGDFVVVRAVHRVCWPAGGSML